MGDPIISLEEVTVRKSKGLPLEGISFNVAKNEFIGIIGPNGAGKTTLLKVLAGFERFEGVLRLFGRREFWNRTRETRLRIGYIPQMCPFDPAFPILALEAVMMGAIGRLGPFCSPGREEKEKAIHLMEMMRVGHRADRPLGQLSGGERQKVSLARAILQEPDILLMDEPTAGLDIAVQREVLALINEIHHREDMTFLYVTHDFTMLPEAMHRAILLDRGRTYFDGNVADAISDDVLSGLFRYPIAVFKRNGRRYVSYD